MLKYWSDFVRARLRDKRPLMDEPLAAFSVEWLHSRFGCRTVFLVRHPAAIANSRKQLGHLADFSQLLRQPLLMRDFLSRYERELTALQGSRDDLIGNACLLWRTIYGALTAIRERVPDLLIVRHEDLARNPLAEFERIHRWLEVPFDEATRRFVVSSTSARADKPGATLEQRRKRAHSWSISRNGISKTGFRPLDSKAYVVKWKRELTRAEIARIRSLTADVAPSFYGDEDW